jgi:methylthioribose-1-phosphate isomerase
MNRIRSLLSASEKDGSSAGDLLDKVKTLCGEVHSEDVERCREKRGGGEKKGLKVLTVCNTGSLATSVSYILFYPAQK